MRAYVFAWQPRTVHLGLTGRNGTYPTPGFPLSGVWVYEVATDWAHGSGHNWPVGPIRDTGFRATWDEAMQAARESLARFDSQPPPPPTYREIYGSPETRTYRETPGR